MDFTSLLSGIIISNGLGNTPSSGCGCGGTSQISSAGQAGTSTAKAKGSTTQMRPSGNQTLWLVVLAIVAYLVLKGGK